MIGRTQASTRAQTHEHPRGQTQACMHKRTHKRKHTHTQEDMSTDAHKAYELARMPAYICTQTRIYTCTHACTYARKPTCTHSLGTRRRMPPLAHECTHAESCSRNQKKHVQLFSHYYIVSASGRQKEGGGGTEEEEV